METMQVQTHDREAMVDITGAVRRMIGENGWSDGALLLYCPHTTGAVTINEGADPDVVRDILVNMRKLVPHRGDYHHAEGNSDAHIKSSMFGCDQLVIVEGGNIQLGTWQKIYFCEFDGPRTRKLWVKFLSGL
ncbi:secondary thiamine-phosphate synthase enzyme YjbQ [Pseudodesulfovibrio senegalensis]|uniref:YjbQ family protein n=1 Tax=Pseudodesulfovibrio senegalensis TaxID=1721087 RepID=A0A6N6N653_9BACT|nr:secondary thiamine-phosphate synthase enzyme YjbQ [Pseudodesulfovibrio senegalensis]KAB1442965.1 YjbQ family protein [Pseudodesulfovibrio senegalensis]